MKSYGTIKVLITAMIVSIGMNMNLNAQSYTLNNKSSSLIVEGTSNIHDWTMEAESTSGTISAEMDEGKLEEIDALRFTAEAEGLKSGKSGMDKNAYKALNTSKYKKITYELKNVKEITGSNGNYKAKTTGSLEIAGVKKDIALNFNLTISPDKIILKGEHNLNMTDYGVEPPTAMFGTITTGETVKIKFETHFNK
ncbi:YceI family protein [Christiangramia crocea]|uniref:YceI family protein n=1 Tax=Christiangramia crocea TaxID=2904124 RepID=A0A9X1UW75_9FLAO|nr:YceI family protein [Gramella crocea]MCG9971572.1 YceI family protein [Gramella crocea]